MSKKNKTKKHDQNEEPKVATFKYFNTKLPNTPEECVELVLKELTVADTLQTHSKFLYHLKDTWNYEYKPFMFKRWWLDRFVEDYSTQVYLHYFNDYRLSGDPEEKKKELKADTLGEKKQQEFLSKFL